MLAQSSAIALYLEETIGGNTDEDTEADKGADKGADKNADPDEYEDEDTELLLSKSTTTRSLAKGYTLESKRSERESERERRLERERLANIPN
ncbi:hypothetical protein B0A50_04211 [Salinomyces thailandicus]|uniref:Uncharacterized protein n=1 Tax=Salinomyces thailandicus TaxID=706561 RepID=A0A4V5N4L3_9PEZI|nr:hypothetical protein B0A50_04211 [Salinomyces thailandica]